MTITRWSRSRLLPLVIAGGLLLLILVLARLQWRWIGEVGALERHRLQATLMMTGARLAEDVDREVMRVIGALHPDFGAPPAERVESMIGQLERWRREAPHPAVVGAVYLIRPAGAAGPALERLQLAERRFVPSPWPPQLAALRAELHEPRAHGQPKALIAAGVPVLVIPFGFPRASTSAGDSLVGSGLLVELDPHALATELLPRLARDALQWSAGEDVVIAVVDPSRAGGVLYRSDPAAPTERRDADLCLPIINVRPLADLHQLLESRHSTGAHAAALHAGGACGDSRDGWWLLVSRRGDSVDEAVAALRRRNLAASLGILGLLALTAVVLVGTTQRAQRLARQQIEFVAGVTHELHTPLTAIRAAGENLADGVVADPAHVRRYGALIEAEGRRLSTMVAHLLELAGIQSGRRAYRFEAVDAVELVDRALHESRWLLEESGVAVERDLADGLPAVRADARALGGVVQNLLENAVKHGGAGRWLGVRARATAAGVDIAIADRGPGIPRDELPRLFEPFFRGRDAAASGIPGVGLGLALVQQIVEAHGGSVGVASEATGTTVTLHLPAAESPEVAA